MVDKAKRLKDTNQLAKFIVDVATGQIPSSDPYEGKNRRKVDSGRLGGLKGGLKRAKNLTPKRRRSIAKKAASTRWKRYNGTGD